MDRSVIKSCVLWRHSSVFSINLSVIAENKDVGRKLHYVIAGFKWIVSAAFTSRPMYESCEKNFNVTGRLDTLKPHIHSSGLKYGRVPTSDFTGSSRTFTADMWIWTEFTSQKMLITVNPITRRKRWLQKPHVFRFVHVIKSIKSFLTAFNHVSQSLY